MKLFIVGLTCAFLLIPSRTAKAQGYPEGERDLYVQQLHKRRFILPQGIYAPTWRYLEVQRKAIGTYQEKQVVISQKEFEAFIKRTEQELKINSSIVEEFQTQQQKLREQETLSDTEQKLLKQIEEGVLPFEKNVEDIIAQSKRWGLYFGPSVIVELNKKSSLFPNLQNPLMILSKLEKIYSRWLLCDMKLKESPLGDNYKQGDFNPLSEEDLGPWEYENTEFGRILTAQARHSSQKCYLPLGEHYTYLGNGSEQLLDSPREQADISFYLKEWSKFAVTYGLAFGLVPKLLESVQKALALQRIVTAIRLKPSYQVLAQTRVSNRVSRLTAVLKRLHQKYPQAIDKSGAFVAVGVVLAPVWDVLSPEDSSLEAQVQSYKNSYRSSWYMRPLYVTAPIPTLLDVSWLKHFSTNYWYENVHKIQKNILDGTSEAYDLYDGKVFLDGHSDINDYVRKIQQLLKYSGVKRQSAHSVAVNRQTYLSGWAPHEVCEDDCDNAFEEITYEWTVPIKGQRIDDHH